MRISGSQVRQFCCCSSTSSSNLTVSVSSSSSGGGGGSSSKRSIADSVVRQQQQDLPRITFYNNGNNHQSDKSRADKRQHKLSKSSQRLIGANEKLEREIWRAARNYHLTDHYDYSLYGLHPDMDQAVGRHQRETMLYNQVIKWSKICLATVQSSRTLYSSGMSNRQERSNDSSQATGGGSGGGGGPEQKAEEDPSARQTDPAAADDEEDIENEENLHEQMHRQRQQSNNNQHHHHHHHQHQHHRHHHHQHDHGHVKELIKPDRTVRVAARSASAQPARSPTSVGQAQQQQQPASLSSSPPPTGSQTAKTRVAVVVDEDQLHKRFVESVSERRKIEGAGRDGRNRAAAAAAAAPRPLDGPGHSNSTKQTSQSSSSKSSSSGKSKSSSSSSATSAPRSPPPAAIIIPPEVAKSLSNRSRSPAASRTSDHPSTSNSIGSITREQLEYGPLLKKDEVQVLYRSPITDLNDRHLKEEQAKLVAPSTRQSPIAIMTMNPTYELQNKPLIIEYPATLENLKLNNTGFSWEVKLPYQISMTTALHGAHLNTSYCFRLDQFHCHWGSTDDQGSEHTVDNKCYSAELHFVHYNMEKYHTMSKAARHPDGLVVVSVFLDAQADHRNHAELEKIVSQLKSVTLKGEHAIIRQAVRIENLLPGDRSYWSYQGSLTTPPYFESVTWFVLKHPIRCSNAQIQKFRNLKSSLRQNDNDDDDDEEETTHINTNHRKTQPLNGRTIVSYDETSSSGLLRSSSRSMH